MYKNTFSRDPDLNWCWDVHIDQVTSYPGATGTEHNTIGIEQAPNDNRFSGFVSNSPLTEDRKRFGYRGKDFYITHWDSITKATLQRKEKFSGNNQVFSDSSNRDSKTAFATAIRLDSNTCCDKE